MEHTRLHPFTEEFLLKENCQLTDKLLHNRRLNGKGNSKRDRDMVKKETSNPSAVILVGRDSTEGQGTDYFAL